MSEGTNDIVHTIIKNIKSNNNDDVQNSSAHVENEVAQESSKQSDTNKLDHLSGKPKSGRFWKSKKER